MRVTVCPFCGVASDAPHVSQEACIQALQSEIARTRQILTHVGEPLARPAPEIGEDPQHT